MAASDADKREARRRLFEREVKRLMDRLYGTALRLTRDRDEAEDVVADAVERAWARLDQLHEPERIEGWLFQILTNAFLSSRRRRRSRQDRETGLDAVQVDSGSGEPADFSLFEKLHQPFLLWWSAPERAFLNHLLHEDIRRALDELPEVYRVVVVLVELQGRRYDEVARQLAIPVGTVRSRLSRGRSLLQQRLWEQAREAGLVSDVRGTNPTEGGRR